MANREDQTYKTSIESCQAKRAINQKEQMIYNACTC